MLPSKEAFLLRGLRSRSVRTRRDSAPQSPGSPGKSSRIHIQARRRASFCYKIATGIFNPQGPNRIEEARPRSVWPEESSEGIANTPLLDRQVPAAGSRCRTYGDCDGVANMRTLLPFTKFIFSNDKIGKVPINKRGGHRPAKVNGQPSA